jgi:exodeoxyribonuclease V alpha subunit
VCADIIDSGTVPVVRLDVVQRAAASTWVYRAAPKVLEGGWEHARQDQTYKAVWSSDPNEARAKIVDIVSVRMPRAGITDVQVMAPMYGGPLGVMALNSALQEALNPTRYNGGDPESGLAFRSRGAEVVIRERDRVVQLTNDYTRAVFNGEIGVVKKITPELVVVEFDNLRVDYDHATARTSLALAYALTVHRMQGSQTKWAVVAMSADHARMWSRQILYTAITRAREGVCVVGDRSALQIALSSTYDSDRITFLRSRLSGEEEENHDARDDSGSEWVDS